MHYTSEATRNRAKRLRRTMGLTERRLWRLLRANQLDGLHFRRQHPLGAYVLDFYCHAARLAVEIDGGVHNMPGGFERDKARDAWLLQLGIATLRLTNGLVENDINAALGQIRTAVAARLGAAERP